VLEFALIRIDPPYNIVMKILMQ